MTNRLIALTEGSRALKIQELILKAMAGELRWYQAAEIAGISDTAYAATEDTIRGVWLP
jgi:hypothetical protein